MSEKEEGKAKEPKETSEVVPAKPRVPDPLPDPGEYRQKSLPDPGSYFARWVSDVDLKRDDEG